jgi:hypothetical protein
MNSLIRRSPRHLFGHQLLKDWTRITDGDSGCGVKLQPVVEAMRTMLLTRPVAALKNCFRTVGS